MSTSCKAKFDLFARMAADVRLGASYFRALAVMLMRFHNTKTGQCNPSLSKLASAAGVTKKTVIAATEAGEELGYLKPTAKSDGGRNRRNSYSFALSETVYRGNRFDDANGVADDPKRCTAGYENGVPGALAYNQERNLEEPEDESDPSRGSLSEIDREASERLQAEQWNAWQMIKKAKAEGNQKALEHWQHEAERIDGELDRVHPVDTSGDWDDV
jgi:hypothetical protein